MVETSIATSRTQQHPGVPLAGREAARIPIVAFGIMTQALPRHVRLRRPMVGANKRLRQLPTLASTSALRNRSINNMKPIDGTSRIRAVIEAIW
jgi:hypothetical protein